MILRIIRKQGYPREIGTGETNFEPLATCILVVQQNGHGGGVGLHCMGKRRQCPGRIQPESG